MCFRPKRRCRHPAASGARAYRHPGVRSPTGTGGAPLWNKQRRLNEAIGNARACRVRALDGDTLGVDLPVTAGGRAFLVGVCDASFSPREGRWRVTAGGGANADRACLLRPVRQRAGDRRRYSGGSPSCDATMTDNSYKVISVVGPAARAFCCSGLGGREGSRELLSAERHMLGSCGTGHSNRRAS
jgi:hypothetical protein